MRVFLFVIATFLVADSQAQISALPANDTSVDQDARTALPAASFGRAPVRLTYDHVTQQMSLQSANGDTEQVWERGDGVPYAEVPTDRPVVVEVRNANTLVYTYELDATVAALRESPPSCGTQARSFVLAGGLIAGGSTSPGANVSLPAGGSFEDFLDFDLSGVSGLTRGDAAVPTTELIQIERDLAPVVDRLEGLAVRLADARNQARATLLRAAERGDAEPIGPMLRAIQERLNAVEPGLGDPSRVPSALDRLVPDGADQLGALSAAADAVEAGNIEDPTDSAAAGVSELAARAAAAREQASDAAAEIQRIALRVERALEGTTQRVTVRPGDDIREVTFRIGATADTAFASVIRTRADDVTAYLGPRAPRGFGCAIAVALTFSPQLASYNVRPDGTLFDDSDGLRSSPAVLFELAPPALGSVLGLVGGVGLGESFAPDLYAGASLRLLRPVLLTGGAVWRRARALPEGLALGDIVGDDPDFILERFRDDLPREWSPSFFLGLSVVP